MEGKRPRQTIESRNTYKEKISSRQREGGSRKREGENFTEKNRQKKTEDERWDKTISERDHTILRDKKKTTDQEILQVELRFSLKRGTLIVTERKKDKT